MGKVIVTEKVIKLVMAIVMVMVIVIIIVIVMTRGWTKHTHIILARTCFFSCTCEKTSLGIQHNI